MHVDDRGGDALLARRQRVDLADLPREPGEDLAAAGLLPGARGAGLHPDLEASLSAAAAVEISVRPAGAQHQHAPGSPHRLGDRVPGEVGVAPVVQVGEHPDLAAAQHAHGPQSAQRVLHRRGRSLGSAHPLATQPLRLATEGVPRLVEPERDVEVEDEERATLEPRLRLPGADRTGAREILHRLEPDLHELPLELGRGRRHAHGVVGPARATRPLPDPSLHLIPPLRHELEDLVARVLHLRRDVGGRGRTEVARAGHLHEPVHDGGEVHPHRLGGEHVGAARAHGREAVDLQDPELPARVEAVVDARAVRAAERRERLAREILRFGGQLLADLRRTGQLHLAPGLAGLVLVAIDRRALPEEELDGKERLRRRVAEQPDVDLAPLDELLGQHSLVEGLEDDVGRLAQLLLVVDDLDAEGDGLVARLDDHRVGELGNLGVAILQHDELRGGQTVLQEDHLRDDLVERERVRQRTGSHVGHADHLQDARHVRVAGLTLQAVRDVEHEAGTLALDHARHEVLQPGDEVLVRLEGPGLVAALAQGVRDALDLLEAELLAVGAPEEIDDVLAVPVVDDGDFHDSRAASVGVESAPFFIASGEREPHEKRVGRRLERALWGVLGRFSRSRGDPRGRQSSTMWLNFNHEVDDIHPMITRKLIPRLRDSLSDSPVVFLQGARQTGKSTLTKELASRGFGESGGPARYLTLDDPVSLASARSDPDGFLAGIEEPVVIDEVQRSPDLARAIKRSVDGDRRPGRFLLTGSASVRVVPEISEFLAGRMEIHVLWPLSRGEIHTRQETFIDRAFEAKSRELRVDGPIEDLWPDVVAGGFPEALKRRRRDRRDAWFDSYVTTVLQREVRDLANVEGLSRMPQLLDLLASRVAGPVNFADLSRGLGIPQTTLKRYTSLLEATFLVHLVPAWTRARAGRLVKSPKLFLVDTGLLVSRLGIDADSLRSRASEAGPVLESFVFQEFHKQAGWSAVGPRIHHFRTHGGREVDLVLEDRRGRVVGVEVKASAGVHPGDLAGLKALRDAAGKRFLRGIVLYGGAESVTFAPDLMAIPLQSLWSD